MLITSTLNALNSWLVSLSCCKFRRPRALHLWGAILKVLKKQLVAPKAWRCLLILNFVVVVCSSPNSSRVGTSIVLFNVLERTNEIQVAYLAGYRNALSELVAWTLKSKDSESNRGLDVLDLMFSCLLNIFVLIYHAFLMISFLRSNIFGVHCSNSETS
jgi:hypothetical protein